MTKIPVLFEHYPELQNKVPWLELGSFPTPVEEMKNLGADDLWIKRDDQSCSLYGGNKIRKLEFIMGDVLSKNKKHVITMGGIGTNHGLATGVICNSLGIRCTLLLFEQPVTPWVKHNLLLFKKFNAELKFKGSLWNTVWSFYLFNRFRNPGAYYLFAGGSTVIGTLGFVNAMFELKGQIDRKELPEPECIFCPLGSNGTLAGLTLGAGLAGLSSRIVGVRVTASHLGPVPASTPAVVRKLMKETYRYLKKRAPGIPDVAIEEPCIIDDFFGGAYGLPTREGLEAVELGGIKEGVKLEPTYTGKTFAAFLEHCREKKKEGPLLFWNTYSSIDLSAEADSVDYHKLPADLQRFITTENVLI